jgi:hypothetical protein
LLYIARTCPGRKRGKEGGEEGEKSLNVCLKSEKRIYPQGHSQTHAHPHSVWHHLREMIIVKGLCNADNMYLSGKTAIPHP